jgi:predicted transposase/invertase (TIGR01784 family)
MGKIHSPHDKFFKRSMANIEVAKDFFKHHLPTEMLARVNLDTLQLKQTSFINDYLGATAADILYSVQIDGRRGYLYALCEQQSEPDKLMPFRILVYKLQIMQQHLDETGSKELPLVHAMVFYNGRKPYHYSTDIFDLFADKELAKATLFEPFQLIKASDISDDEIMQYKYGGLLELAAKHIHDQDIQPCLQVLGKHMQSLQHEGVSEYGYFMLIFLYIAKAGNIQDKGAFAETVQQVLPREEGEEIMTIVEMYKQEGLQEGLCKGLQEGRFEEKIEVAKKLLNKGSDISTIVELTDLPRSKIEELKKQILH